MKKKKKAAVLSLKGPKTNWISKCLRRRKFEVSQEGSGGGVDGGGSK